MGGNKAKKIVLLFQKVNAFVTWLVRSLQLGQNHQTAGKSSQQQTASLNLKKKSTEGNDIALQQDFCDSYRILKHNYFVKLFFFCLPLRIKIGL